MLVQRMIRGQLQVGNAVYPFFCFTSMIPSQSLIREIFNRSIRIIRVPIIPIFRNLFLLLK